MPPQNDWAHTFMSAQTQCGTQRATPNGRSIFSPIHTRKRIKLDIFMFNLV
jgi:hypothetical protein